MSNFSIKIMITVIALGFSSAVLSSIQPPTRDELDEVMKAHASELAAIIACKDYLQNGDIRLEEAKSKTAQVLGKLIGNVAKGNEYTSRIYKTVFDARPDTQLKTEFDKVNLDNSVRVAKCTQLVAGNAARAADIDSKYLK